MVTFCSIIGIMLLALPIPITLKNFFPRTLLTLFTLQTFFNF
jgi:hypothetical protein